MSPRVRRIPNGVARSARRSRRRDRAQRPGGATSSPGGSMSHPIHRFRTWTSIGLVLATLVVAAPVSLANPPTPGPASGCQLRSATGDIQRVVFLIFDNVHFRRDNPNVPSDLEQMPNLLDFVR